MSSIFTIKLIKLQQFSTELINTRPTAGKSRIDAKHHRERLRDRIAMLQVFMDAETAKSTDMATFAMDPTKHGAPTNFSIVKSRERRIRGAQLKLQQQNAGTVDESACKNANPSTAHVITRQQFEQQRYLHYLNQRSDAYRLAAAQHARRGQRAVIGTQFVPNTIDDLPANERNAILRARSNRMDKLQYEIRETDTARDNWRINVIEHAGRILPPPIGRVGVC